jgi:hypothetical protein
MILGFVLLFCWFYVMMFIGTAGNDDRFIPLIVLIAVLVMRVAQTFTEARRLYAQGWSTDEIQRGMRAVVAESEARRQQLRTDGATMRARRRTVLIAVAMMALAPLLFWGALQFRTQTGPSQYQTSLAGALLLIGALLNFGFAMPLLMRSPLRMPPANGCSA